MKLWNSITVTRISSVFTVPSERGRHLLVKDRKYYGLSFCTGEGRIVYTHNGKRYESDRTCAILLPCGASYSLSCPEAGDFPLINFSAETEIPIETFALTPLGSPESYLKDYERLREAVLIRNDRARALSILYAIFARLAGEEARAEHPRLEPALRYLTENAFDPSLTIRSVAEAAGLSEAYLRRIFHSAYGVSPKQYLLETRIRKAELLLTEESATVTEIAEACGFQSLYHFCRAFKSATGETPTEHRKKERLYAEAPYL